MHVFRVARCPAKWVSSSIKYLGAQLPRPEVTWCPATGSETQVALCYTHGQQTQGRVAPGDLLLLLTLTYEAQRRLHTPGQGTKGLALS